MKTPESILKRRFFDGQWLAIACGTAQECWHVLNVRREAGDKLEDLKVEAI